MTIGCPVQPIGQCHSGSCSLVSVNEGPGEVLQSGVQCCGGHQVEESAVEAGSRSSSGGPPVYLASGKRLTGGPKEQTGDYVLQGFSTGTKALH